MTDPQMEYDLLQELAPLPNQTSETYATLLVPLMSLFTSTLTSLTALIKSSLHKYTFLALSSYAELSLLNERWDRMLSWRGAGNSRARETNELKEGLHGLRAICLRSFPEFLADIKLASVGKGEEMNTAVAQCSITVGQFCLIIEIRVNIDI
jgi:exocyst complex component 7